MFSVQPENAIASYSSARQKPGHSDQSSGSGNFGALVDSNATAADTDRPAGNQSDTPVRRGERDERQVKRNDAADVRPARQDNSDQDTQVAGSKKLTKADDKDTAENPDTSKPTVSDKAGGKIKAARNAKDVTDSDNTDQTTATAASAIIPAAPTAVAVIAATTPAAETISAGETPASAIAATVAVTTATSAAAETVTGAATETEQPSPATTSPDQTSVQSATNKATSENTADSTSQPDDGSAVAPANGEVAADPSAPQPLNAVASEVTPPAGVELAASIVPNGKTMAASAVKSAVLTKADAKNDESQTVPAENNKDAKAATTIHSAGKPDADESDVKAVKDGKGADGSGDTKAASPDKPVPAAHEPRIAAQPLMGDPSQQPANAQQQPTQIQPSNTAATPTAQLNATLAAANTPVPLNSLAVDIALKAAGGNSRFEIRLDPAELGRIDVRLDVDKHGQVTSHLTVERPATLDMLRKDAPQLQQALEDAGLKTGNGGLQFSLRDQSSSGQQNNDQSGRNSQRLIITEDTPVPAQIAGQTYGRALGSRSGVDIRI